MKRMTFLIIISLFILQITAQSKLERQLIESGMIEVQSQVPEVWVELKYATTDNFTKAVLYDDLHCAYLHPLSIEKLKIAVENLKKTNSNLSFIIYDAARPQSVQYKMYETVKGTPFASYVANPTRTGLHNYGMAIDLTLCDEFGRPLDMGTTFDFFGKAAAIRDEDGLIEEGILTKEQVANRRLLRKVMTEAGFQTVKGEWWHFNTVPLHEAKANYKLLK